MRAAQIFFQTIAVGLLLAAPVVATSPSAHAESEGAGGVVPVADAALSTADVVVQSLGSGDAKIQLVDHGDSWSMHVENVLAQDIFHLWHEAGGPEVVMKTPLDFPFTFSVHRMSTERIVERILEGWGRTLHFDAKGRLELVRIYSPRPARLFKTPRLVESLGTWRQVEAAKATHPDGTPETSGQAPSPVLVAPVAPPPSRPVPVPEPVDDPMADDPAH